MFVFLCSLILYNLGPDSTNSHNLPPFSRWACLLQICTLGKRTGWLFSCILFGILASMVPIFHNYSNKKPNWYISLQRRHQVSEGPHGLASGIRHPDRICTETICWHLAVWIEEIGRHEPRSYRWISWTGRMPIQAIRIRESLTPGDNRGQTFTRIRWCR